MAATAPILPAPPTSGTRTSVRLAQSLLIHWHLLSLDAPTVAALWTWAIARSAHLTLPVIIPVAVFLAVWILYAADRLLDARPLQSNRSFVTLEPRHVFHFRHRALFRTAILLAALTLIPILLAIPAAAIRLYLILAALLLAWLLLVHLPAPGITQRRLPKESILGLFFAAAIFIPTVARAPALRTHLLPSAILFATLCSVNCLYIYAWEHPQSDLGAEPHPTTRVALAHLSFITLVLISAAILLTPQNPLNPAVAVSAAILLSLHHHRPRNPTLLRASADLALLTPALMLPFLR